MIRDDMTAQIGLLLRGELIRPTDPNYDEARSVWNGMIDKRPALVVRAVCVEDVQAAVNFARAHDLLVSVRGGGHNVAGTAVADGGLVIDLSGMKAIQVDPDARIVRAEGGVLLGELDAATQQYGLAMPLGVVTQTGIAGLTLGGGLGWLRRKYGLSCDNLVAADVVTADGRLVRASETENPDLLWALRRGGGNFGVVTAFEYRLHPVGPDVMFACVFYPVEMAREAMCFYREYCDTAPDEVSSFSILGTVPTSPAYPEEIRDCRYVMFLAMYSGPVDDGERIIQPLRDFATPMLDLSGPMPFLDVQRFFDEDYPDHVMRYYWKSVYLNSLDDQVIEALLALNEKRPSPHSTLDVWQLGGAITRFGPEHSAFSNRDKPFLLGIESNWEHAEDDGANIEWTREVHKTLERFSDGAQYLNFPGFHEDPEATMRATFGHGYNRLVAVKDKYDPGNLFRLNQNIRPSR